MSRFNMYKTVRQGENSLQYTILPQTEEVLSNSGIKGKGRDYSPSTHVRRISRKLMVYYMAIIFFGLLLVFGTLLFALILSGIVPIDLPNHINSVKHEKLTAKSTTPCSTVQPDKSPTRKKELAHDMKLSQETSTHKSLSITLNKTTVQQNENNTVIPVETVLIVTPPPTTIAPNQTVTTEQAWIMPALKRLQLSTTPTPTPNTDVVKLSTLKTIEKLSSPYAHQRESNNDLMLGHDQIKWPDYEGDDDEDYDMTKTPMTTSTSTTNQSTSTVVSVVSANVTDAIKIVQNKTVAENDSKDKNKSKMDTVKYMEMKEHILDDDDEDYKEPLADEDDVSEQTGNDDVKMSQTKSSWLQTRWPFVDPSSYFQWTVSCICLH